MTALNKALPRSRTLALLALLALALEAAGDLVLTKTSPPAR